MIEGGGGAILQNLQHTTIMVAIIIILFYYFFINISWYFFKWYYPNWTTFSQLTLWSALPLLQGICKITANMISLRRLCTFANIISIYPTRTYEQRLCELEPFLLFYLFLISFSLHYCIYIVTTTVFHLSGTTILPFMELL